MAIARWEAPDGPHVFHDCAKAVRGREIIYQCGVARLGAPVGAVLGGDESAAKPLMKTALRYLVTSHVPISSNDERPGAL
eukprot:5807785-Pyramimonas_sp.AAC.1